MREYIPEGYGLQKYRIRELYAFCRQYADHPPSKRYVIEKAAFEASDGSEIMRKALLKNVTEGTPLKSIDVPCGTATFSRLRKRFFWLLDKVV